MFKKVFLMSICYSCMFLSSSAQSIFKGKCSGSECINIESIDFNEGNEEKSYGDMKVYYQKACDLDDARGCTNLGVLYEEGSGVKKNYSHAKQYYQKACDLDDARGCTNLGVLCEKGNGVQNNHSDVKA